MKYILVAGGTGGHVIPAIALGEELKKMGHTIILITDGRFTSPLFDIFDFVYEKPILRKKGFLGKFVYLTSLLYRTLNCLWILRKECPEKVIGFGGYPSIPGVLAAQILKIPTLIHEQNYKVGKANRFLSKRAKIIALSFADTSFSTKCRKEITGTPLLSSFKNYGNVPFPFLGENDVFRLLVIGGSLGSKIFSDVIPKAIKLLSPHIKKQLVITQQCRKEDKASVKLFYEKESINARLESFFYDMPALYRESHLVISRSGASTVAELCAIGRPAILIPYGASIEHDQTYNAKAITAHKGGWMIEEKAFTPQALAALLTHLLKNPHLLKEAAQQCRALSFPDASFKLAKFCEQNFKSKS